MAGPVARALALAALVVVAACGSTPKTSRTSGASTTTTSPATTSTSTVPLTTTTAPVTTTTTTIALGLLPQTDVEPPTGGALLAAMTPLWAAIVSGSTAHALPLFFPEAAYVKMKTGLLGSESPSTDYVERLIGFYKLDLAAYHQALEPDPTGARLISVDAAPADAAWISPGGCENLIGYWHLPGVRFVYSEGGVVKSFAVASLISWRGVWYVVHLGPNPRPVDVGTVDQPAAGRGTPGPAGGC
jgi:hypothetical protein